MLVCSVSLGMMALVSAGAWFVPWGAWMKLRMTNDHSAAQIMLVFSAYALLSLQNGILDSAFRCDDMRWEPRASMLCASRRRPSQPFLCSAAADSLLVAVTYLGVRVIGCVLLMQIVRRKSPWIHYGIAHANPASVRRLSSPAFAFMAFPIGNAVSLQGLTVVVAIVLGPVAVVAFSTMRTLSRVGFQVLNAIARTLWPELSTAFGAGDISLARNLHRRACQVAFVLSMTCSVTLGVIGPHIYGRWTQHAVRFEPLTFNLLLLVILANSVWYASYVRPHGFESAPEDRLGVHDWNALCRWAWRCRFYEGTRHHGSRGRVVLIDCSMVWLVSHGARPAFGHFWRFRHLHVDGAKLWAFAEARQRGVA